MVNFSRKKFIKHLNPVYGKFYYFCSQQQHAKENGNKGR